MFGGRYRVVRAVDIGGEVHPVGRVIHLSASVARQPNVAASIEALPGATAPKPAQAPAPSEKER